MNTPVRLTQFTGSSRIGEILAEATHGKVKLEDAGFDWKILGPDVGEWTMWLGNAIKMPMPVRVKNARRSPFYLSTKIGRRRVLWTKSRRMPPNET